MSMEAAAGWMIAVVLLGWFVASFAQYLPGVGPVIRRNDRFMIVPQWSFFAPTPNQADFHFFIRLGYGPGPALGHWQEISLSRLRHWTAFVWNPDRRIRKGFFDLTSELCGFAESPRAEVLMSLNYLHLATVASTLAQERHADRVQFGITRTEAFQDVDHLVVLFASEVHAVADTLTGVDS